MQVAQISWSQIQFNGLFKFAIYDIQPLIFQTNSWNEFNCTEKKCNEFPNITNKVLCH